MRFVVSCVCLFVCAVLAEKANALTNRELFDILEPYLDVEDIDEDDVITLPGGPDDDVDVVYLIGAMGLDADDAAAAPPRLALWRRHHRHRPAPGRCHCRSNGCGCCVEHTFRIHLGFKTFTKHLKGCVNVAYLPGSHGFELTVTIDNRRVFHRAIALNRPPQVCYNIPGMGGMARACLQLYDINVGAKHVCARLVGELNLKIKKIKFNIKLGCFNIPTSDDVTDDDVTSQGQVSDDWHISLADTADNEDTATDDYSDDLAERVRLVQDSDESDDVADDTLIF